MQPRTQELLHFLLWSAQRLMRPTFRNLTDSYESWAYRNRLLLQLGRLEKGGLIERERRIRGDRVYRLTEQGRLSALGGRDPQSQWAREWDGQWRMVLFDIPMERNAHRERLRRYLRARGFGCLQGSVWITPDPVGSEREILAGGQVDVGSLLLLEARPAAGESDDEIVAGAWRFDEIHRRYTQLLEVLERCPSGKILKADEAEAMREWAAEERAAWLAAVQLDPLLPERLLPRNYLGRRAWQRRQEVLAQAGEQVRDFRG